MTEQQEEEALITFNAGIAKVLVKNNEQAYLVRWYCDKEYIGEYELSSGMWGAYPLRLGNWRIEFWQNHEKVSEFSNDLKDNPILIIADLSKPLLGKNLSISKLVSRGNEIKTQYGCDVVFYFKGSEQYDLSPFKTLKMNDKYDFSLILEENYG
jgi:hypothetical protein